MTTGFIGQRGTSLLAPVSSFTQRTKLVNLTVTGTNWTTTLATGMFTSDSNGVWRCEQLNIEGSISVAAATLTLTISGVTFKTGANQAVTVSIPGTVSGRGETGSGASTLSLWTGDAATHTSWYITGSVVLDSNPSTYTTLSNLEGVTDVSAYIIGNPTGGLSVVALTAAAASGLLLSTGYHYVIDMSAAAGSISVTVPTGAAGSNIRVYGVGNTTNGYTVTVGAGGSTIWNSGGTIATYTLALESAVEFAWDNASLNAWVIEKAWAQAVVGGGLTPAVATITTHAVSSTLQAGYSYIIDWGNEPTAVGTNITLTLPQLLVGNSIEFVTVGNKTGAGRLVITPYSGDSIIYNGGTVTSSDSLTLLPCDPAWIRFNAAAANKWYCEGQAQFVQGNFAGDLTITGNLVVSGSINASNSGNADVVMTSSSARTQIISATSANRTITLPSTGIKAGTKFSIIHNRSTKGTLYHVYVKSTDTYNAMLCKLRSMDSATITALIDTPTRPSHFSTTVVRGKKAGNPVKWTIRSSAADNQWYSVCWSAELGLFCAVANDGTGTGNRVMTSPDGITWTIRSSAADNNWRSICWSAELGLFCAVSYDGTGNHVMTYG